MTDPTFGLSQRQPPSNLAAEQALLGALLANNKAYEQVSDFLRAEHFADAVHARIYAAIARRIDAGQVADVVTLRGDFENSGTIDDAGGPAYLAELLSAMVGIINAGAYGRVVRDTWLRRQLIDAGEVMVNLAFGADGELSADQVMEQSEAQLFALGEVAKGGGSDLQSAEAVSHEVMAALDRGMKAKGGLIGITSGYRAFDRLKGGFLPGEFILVAGRPAMGKTAFVAGVAARAAHAGARVLIESCEMPAAQVQARMVAARSRVPLQGVLRGMIIDQGSNVPRPPTQAEFDSIFAANAEVGRLPITWDARGRPTVASIRARARRLKARQGLDLIIIDYIGLLASGLEGGRGNRNEELTRISADIKAMAVELGVPVVVLSQLSREVERREDKRPILADLRDSGSLEQDADMVGFLYREHYYLQQSMPTRRDKETDAQFEARLDTRSARLRDSDGVAELIVAKHRQGATGTVRLRWEERLTWFRDESEDGGHAASHAAHADDASAPGGASTGDPA